MRDKWRVILASAFGLGLSPIVPGSCAALLGVLIYVVVAKTVNVSLQVPVLVLFFLFTCIGNHLLTPWAQKYWKNKDPKQFVLDEIAGYLLVPILFRHGQLWQVAFWGYLGFRTLDVIKVPPAWQIDKYGTGAWAILMDDIVSGMYTVFGLYIMKWVGPIIGVERWFIC